MGRAHPKRPDGGPDKDRRKAALESLDTIEARVRAAIRQMAQETEAAWQAFKQKAAVGRLRDLSSEGLAGRVPRIAVSRRAGGPRRPARNELLGGRCGLRNAGRTGALIRALRPRHEGVSGAPK